MYEFIGMEYVYGINSRATAYVLIWPTIEMIAC